MTLVLILMNLLFSNDTTTPQIQKLFDFQDSSHLETQPLPYNLVSFGPKIYFRSGDRLGPAFVWATDGPATGLTQVLVKGHPFEAETLQVFGDVLYFAGAHGGPNHYLTKTSPEPIPLPENFPTAITHDGAEGIFAWAGTTSWHFSPTEGVSQSPAFFPEANLFHAQPPIRFKGKVYAVATYNQQLFLVCSDGTVEGTGPLVSLSANPGYIGHFEWSVFEDQLVFLVEAAGIGAKLWTTDGTASGTHNITQSSIYATDMALLASQESLYYAYSFAESDASFGSLYRYDREDGEQERLFQTSFQVGFPAPIELLALWHDGLLFYDNVHEKLYLTGTEGVLSLGSLKGRDYQASLSGNSLFLFNGDFLFHLDGEGHLENLFTQFHDGFHHKASMAPFIDDFGRAYFFSNDDPDTLWISDGTIAGTNKTDVDEHFGLWIQEMVSLNGVVYFPAWEIKPLAHYEDSQLLSRDRDGQLALIPPVKRVVPPLFQEVKVGNQLVFLDLESPKNIHFMDVGTTTVRTIQAETQPEVIDLSVLVPPNGYLMGTDRHIFWKAQNKLWASDDTQPPTELFEYLAPSIESHSRSADKLYLVTDKTCCNPNELTQIWGSDGTVAGTSQLTTDFDLSQVTGTPQVFGDGAGGAYLVAIDPNFLYIGYTDGQDPQIQELARFPQIPDKSFTMPTMEWVHGYAWFLFQDQTHPALIRSDATPEGTTLFLDQYEPWVFGLGDEVALYFQNKSQFFEVIQAPDQPFQGFQSSRNVTLKSVFEPGLDGILYGQDTTNTIWGYGPNGVQRIGTQPSGIARTYQRWDTSKETVLIAPGWDESNIWLTDGSEAGTRALSDGPWPFTILEQYRLGETLYVSGERYGDRTVSKLYQWHPGDSWLEEVPGDYHAVQHLTEVDGALVFNAIQGENDFGMFRLEPATGADLTLTARPWFWAPILTQVNAESLPGATYEWSISGGSFLGKTNHAHVLVQPHAQQTSTVTLMVTLADGTVHQGHIEIPAK